MEARGRAREVWEQLTLAADHIEALERELAELRAWREGKRGVEEFYAERERARELAGEVARLRADGERVRDIVRGFLWMLDEGMLYRNTQNDHEPSWLNRNVRLVRWLAQAFAAVNPADDAAIDAVLLLFPDLRNAAHDHQGRQREQSDA
jgi:hypothetical protein